VRKAKGNLSALRQKQAILLGVIGLALILFSVKIAARAYSAAQESLDLNGKPALLYIPDDHPCECAKKMIAEADYQIKNWSEPHRMEVQLIRINLGDYPDLEAKYDIFRASTLILLDAHGQVVHRQDYPMIGGKPMDLPEFEAKMEDFNTLNQENPP
jgi:hypothetical protein